MNFLLFYPDEVGTQIHVSNSMRIKHILKVHKACVGKEYQAVFLNQGTGKVTLVERNEQSLIFSIQEKKPFDHWANVTLLIGCPRPQMIKRILRSAQAYGVSEIIFTASELSEKSYLQAKILTEECEQIPILLESAEQSGVPVFPRIILSKSLNVALGKIENANFDQVMLAEQDGISNFCDFTKYGNGNAKLLLVVGPEKGWSEKEQSSFEVLKPVSVNLAPGVLRVDQAVMAGIGRLFNYYIHLNEYA